MAVFNPEHMHNLDTPERRNILPPENILHQIGLKRGDIFLDIGCGIGYFTIPASEIVGERGKVIAIDISQPMLNELERRIEDHALKNIEIKLCSAYKFPIRDRYVDIAFMSAVLHEVEDKERFLKETYRVLGIGKRLIIIEWQKEYSKGGPPAEERLSEQDIKAYIEVCGFRLIKSQHIGEAFKIYYCWKI